MRRQLVWIVGLAGLLSAVSSPGRGQDRFGDSTSVLVVEIPVQVTRDGEPVRGLKASDFELSVDRKKQKLLDFEEIDLYLRLDADGGAPPEPLPAVARRHFLLLFDLSFSNAEAVARARFAAHDLAQKGLHPTDLVGVATYSESQGARNVLGFTSDRRQLELALSTLGILDPRDRVRDPLGIVLADYQTYMERQGGYEADQKDTNPAGFALIPDAQFLNNMKDINTMSARANRQQIKNQILDLSSSLSGLADNLAAVNGRKYVVYFSEGFDSRSLLGTENAEDLERLSKEASFGQLWRVDSDERFGDVGTQQGVFDMLDHFRRCDCTIQAVDIGGLRAGGLDDQVDGQNSLFVLANQTGGELFRNYNDLSSAMDAMLERTSVTYLLSWQPKQPGVPGEFHPIRVKLKGGPKGARVAHRPGYYVPRPYQQMAPAERQLETVDLLMEGREGGRLATSVLAAPFKTDEATADVLTLVEIEGYALLRGHTGERLLLEVFAYAIDEDGAVEDFITQAIDLDLSKVRAPLDQRGFKFLGHLELPPGRFEVRTLVRNALTGATGLRRTTVEVPDFSTPQATLLPPLFIEPQGSWLIGEEERYDGHTPLYPLLAGQRRMVPAARPFLKAGTRVPLLLVGHNLTAGELVPTSNLVPLDGSDAVPTSISLQARSPTAVEGLERLAATLTPGSVAAGEYRLEVTLRDAMTGHEVVSTTPVTIY